MKRSLPDWHETGVVGQVDQFMEATSHDAFSAPEIVDSHKLLIFFMIARCGSIGDAARCMHLTRSALSHALKSLEQDLNCELFYRADRSLTLSPCGQRLLPIAEAIFRHMADIRVTTNASGATA